MQNILNKKYYSQAVCLVKSNNEKDFSLWLHWHLDIIKFDSVVIFDNESSINIKEITKNRKNVIYKRVKGWPNQHKLYNEYMNTASSNWVIALDDDEYLYLSDKYENNVNVFIKTMFHKYKKNKIYILWTNMFSKNIIEERNESYLNTHTNYSYEACNYVYKYYPEDNGYGKCLINTKYRYVYFKNYGKIYNRGHNPTCLNGDNISVTEDCILTKDCHLSKTSFNKDCFIAHFQYKSKNEWVVKCTTTRPSSKKRNLSDKVFVYDKIYEKKDTFIKCDLLLNLLNKEKTQQENL